MKSLQEVPGTQCPSNRNMSPPNSSPWPRSLLAEVTEARTVASQSRLQIPSLCLLVGPREGLGGHEPPGAPTTDSTWAQTPRLDSVQSLHLLPAPVKEPAWPQGWDKTPGESQCPPDREGTEALAQGAAAARHLLVASRVRQHPFPQLSDDRAG